MSGLRRYEVALEAEEDPAPPPGFAFSLQDLLGLLLLFPVAAHVAEGAEVRGLRYRGPSRGMNKAQSRKMDRGE